MQQGFAFVAELSAGDCDILARMNYTIGHHHRVVDAATNPVAG